MSLNRAAWPLLAVAVVAVCVWALVHHEREASPAAGRADVEFGIWTPDANGEPQFVAARDVPHAEGQAFGWRMRAAESKQPIKWVETLKLPEPPESWEGVGENQDVTVSPDGTTATTRGQSVPDGGYIGNVWAVSDGDPLGRYQLTVQFEDGRKATFEFHVVEADGEGDSESPGEVI